MKKFVLVIDDDEGIRKLFCRALEDLPYRVDTAETGEVGLELHDVYRYDVIYLDLNMPGMNGIEVLSKIRAVDKEIPIFIITAFHKDYLEAITDLYEEGLKFEIIHKPLTLDQIASVTTETLEGTKVQKLVKSLFNL